MSKVMGGKCAIARDYLLKIKEKYLAVMLAKQRYAKDYELIFGGGGIDYSKEHVDGGKIESGNKQVEAMADRWAEVEELERDYIEYSRGIAKQLESITYYHGKEILTRRYLLIPSTGRLRSFESITEDMGLIDVRYTQRLHAKALEEFYSKFLNGVQKP